MSLMNKFKIKSTLLICCLLVPFKIIILIKREIYINEYCNSAIRIIIKIKGWMHMTWGVCDWLSWLIDWGEELKLVQTNPNQTIMG